MHNNYYSSDEYENYKRANKSNYNYRKTSKNMSPNKKKKPRDISNGFNESKKEFEDLINDNPILRSNNFLNFFALNFA